MPAWAQLRPYLRRSRLDILTQYFSRRTDATARSEFTRRWWAHLGEMPGPRGAPRTVTQLVKGFPNACVLVVGSPDYISAMEEDLSSAISTAPHPDRIVIVSGLVASQENAQESPNSVRRTTPAWCWRRAHLAPCSCGQENLRRDSAVGVQRRDSASALPARAGEQCRGAHVRPERLTDEQVERFIRAEAIERQGSPAPAHCALFAIEDMPASSHGSKPFFTARMKIRHAS